MTQSLCEIENFLSTEDCDDIAQKCENNKEAIVCNGGFEKQYRIKFVDSKLQEVFAMLFEKYEEFNSSYVLDSFLYVKYENGGSIPVHRDAYNCQATHTFIIYLNDDYEDGETFIVPVSEENGKYVISKKVGKIIIFEGRKELHGCNKVVGIKKILIGKMFI